MFEDLARRLKMIAWIAGIVACVVANATPSLEDLPYAEDKGDQHEESSDFWPCDWIPHPHCPEDPPKEGDQA